MTWLRRTMLAVSAATGILIAVGACYYARAFSARAERHPKEEGKGAVETAERLRLGRKAEMLRAFTESHRYNTKLAFLVDMALPSGKNRFFIVDLKCDSVLAAGLVAHGSGNHTFAIHPEFSNTDGSGYSSLGRYRIGAPYHGRFGRAYKLYGLDSTNDLAYRRSIVLHSFPYIPDAETNPLPICNSRGCPMVSPGFLRQLEPLIDHSSRPVLLWIFK